MSDSTNSYPVGSIVAIKSHPYFHPAPTTLYSGDQKIIPPFMAVAEWVKENPKEKKLYDPTTGDQQSDLVKYRCIWFDDNRGEFQEHWLYESMIGVVKLFEKPKKREEEPSDNLYGQVFTFSTQSWELAKRYAGKYSEKRNTKRGMPTLSKVVEKVQPSLRYVSPDLVVSGTKLNDSNAPLFSTRNGSNEQIRGRSEKLVKVMWFNYKEQKYSEQWLAEEVLVKR